MWGLHKVLKIARQHSIEAAPPDLGETSVMAQVKAILMTLRRVFIKSTATNQSPNGPFRQNLKNKKRINLLNV